MLGKWTAVPQSDASRRRHQGPCLSNRLVPWRQALGLFTSAVALMLYIAGTTQADIFYCPDRPANPGVAVAPCGDTASVFSWFQGGRHDHYGHDAELVADAKRKLESEHYHVTVYGTKGAPPATLANFVKMVGDGVVIFDVHGFDPKTAGRDCTDAKGLFRVEHLSPGPVVCQASQPGLLVETDSSPEAVAHAISGYRKDGFTAAEVEPFVGRPGGGQDKGMFYVAAHHEDMCEGGPQSGKDIHFVPSDLCGLLLTATGIRDTFGREHPRLVIGVACKSLTVASDFGALSYFGYKSTVCAHEALSDTVTVLDRMTGGDGVENRTTVGAFDLQGFEPDGFSLVGPDGGTASADPVVLSPAVEGVAPGPGTTASGGTNKGVVSFDAAMDTSSHSGVITASGCGATISKETWNGDGNVLSFDLNLPQNPPGGSLTLTVVSDKALAYPGKYPSDRLDGNQVPKRSGVAPNGDDYVWHLPCGAPVITEEYSGTMDSTFVEDLSDPSANQQTAHFQWDEKVSVRAPTVDGQYGTPVGNPTLTLSGNVTSTWADTPSFDCTGQFSAIPGPPWPGPPQPNNPLSLSTYGGFGQPVIINATALLPHYPAWVHSTGPSGSDCDGTNETPIAHNDNGPDTSLTTLEDVPLTSLPVVNKINQNYVSSDGRQTDHITATYSVTSTGSG